MTSLAFILGVMPLAARDRRRRRRPERHRHRRPRRHVHRDDAGIFFVPVFFVVVVGLASPRSKVAPDTSPGDA